MCGIAGIVSASQNKFSRQDVEKMSSCLSHRGPDGSSVWQSDDATAILGHNRLAIIDLSDTASQPMHYLERYTIVHNGEIYNYKELRDQLSSHGYVFKTQSDTEVILAAYDHWKDNCLQRFDGMFAFAIWDNKERSLFAARDRFGEKPFYFHVDHAEKTLWFASEMKSFYTQGLKKYEYNGNLLLQYLATGVSHNADSLQTFHVDIMKLPARHFLKFSPYSDAALLDIEPYYDLDKSNRITISAQEAVEQFKRLFFASVQRRLRSDVEIGTSLSGGLDSSSIVAAIHHLQQVNSPQKSFTASFPNFNKDETAYAFSVAKQFNLHHYIASPSESDLVNDIEEFLVQHDEPVSSSSVYAQYKVYELAKQHGVKVLLDGQGADEVLAGYSKYVQWFLQELYIGKQNNQLEKETESFNFLFGFKNKLAGKFPSWAAIQLERRSYKKQKLQPDLNRDFVKEHISHRNIYKPIVKNLNDILYDDMFSGNLEELLRNADRNAMAHGIEVRLPFLNHELVEFVFSLPSIFKMHNGFSKSLLRQAMDKMLPKEIVWRKDKIGFEPPQQQWMGNKQLQQKIHDAKSILVKEKILDRKALNKPVQPKAAHEADNYDWRYLSAASLF
jgi:asparagine synthase (glutamine-hydrolysing)